MRRMLLCLIVLCIVSPLPQIHTAQGHTVLGKLDRSLPYFRGDYHQSNPKNTLSVGHVPGPLAHIWPGSALNMYTGSIANPPGYQSPFQDYEHPLQVAGSKYSPEGAIPASTADRDIIGGIAIGLNFSKPDAFPNPIFR